MYIYIFSFVIIRKFRGEKITLIQDQDISQVLTSGYVVLTNHRITH